ncbi:MAG: hypothetical protein KC636_26260 [Myxococcales bacterium]|nr:hypothetical protein [Myxococcales bacterium]
MPGSPPRWSPTPRLLRFAPLLLMLACASKSGQDVAAPTPVAPGVPIELDGARAQLTSDATPLAWQRSRLAGNTTRLMVGDDRSLPLQDAAVRVQVEGFRARVLIDFVFDNPDDAIYEGTFQIRLPGEASPYFLAFGQSAQTIDEAARRFAASEVWGLDPGQIMARRADQWITPKEARVVQRDVARLAYDETVHPRLPPPTIHAAEPLPMRYIRDPALAEWAGAGVFHAKIFPIAARTAHRVVVGYDVDLERVGDDLALALPLPEDAATVRVDVGVRAEPGARVEFGPSGATATREPDGTRRYQLINPGGPLRLRIASAGASLLAGGDGSGSYFAARYTPAVPTQASVSRGRRAVFAIDTSMSASPEQLNTWLDLTRAVLDNNRGQLREFAVLTFDIEARFWREAFVANTSANVAAALEHVRGLALEGASDLGAALDAATRPRWSKGPAQWDIFLLSDGAVTWGEADPAALSRRLSERAEGALFAYQTAGGVSDPWLLQRLAEATGGALFSIARAGDIDAASRAHRKRPWTIVDVALEGADDLLLDGAPRVVYPGQELLLVGRGQPDRGAQIAMTLRQGERARVVRTTLGASTPSSLAPRIYGEVAVDQLEAATPGAGGAAEAYARHFRVPGRSCSLLMLETEEDYQRFGIAPAQDLERVRDEPASQTLASARASRPKDVRAAFLQELARMQANPARPLRIDPRLEVLLPALPVDMFDRPDSAIELPAHAWGDLEAALRSQLATGAPDDGLVRAEAERHRGAHGGADAVRVLSSLIEANPGDPRRSADLAFSALAWEQPALAARVLEPRLRVIETRPHLSQIYAVGLAEARRDVAAVVYFEAALQGAFAEPDAHASGASELLALDYRRLLRRLAASESPLRLFAERRLAELPGGNYRDADVVISLLWTTEQTDVDLLVTGPDGQACDYRACGIANAWMTVDATEGVGPEAFAIRGGAPGRYQVAARYFSGARHRDDEAARVLVSVYRRPGTPEEVVTRHVATLERVGAIAQIVGVDLDASPPTPAEADALEVAR